MGSGCSQQSVQIKEFALYQKQHLLKVFELRTKGDHNCFGEVTVL